MLCALMTACGFQVSLVWAGGRSRSCRSGWGDGFGVGIVDAAADGLLLLGFSSRYE